MEPTGTNGRWRHNIPTLYGLVPRLSFCWIVDDIEHCPWSRFDSDRLIASRPLAGSRTATGSNPLCGWNECRNGFGSVPSSRICGGHSPGETPGPIPNPVAKARRGDGTALERVWESSAPPHPNFVWTFRSSPLAGSRKVLFYIRVSFPFRGSRGTIGSGKARFLHPACSSLPPGLPAGSPPRVGSREALSVIPGFPPRFRIPMGHGLELPIFLFSKFPFGSAFPKILRSYRSDCIH